MKPDQALQQAHERLKAEVLELTRANEALRRELSEQQFALSTLKGNALLSLAAISGEWYWEQDASHRFVGFEVAHGSSKFNDELIGDAVGKCRWELPGITPLSSSWEAHRAVLDARQPFRGFEYLRTLPDGTSTWFSISGVPLFDSQGRFSGYRGTARDISAARRAEESQRQDFDFINGIVDNVPVALHLKSVEGRHPIRLWNKAAQDLYGVTREEAIGRTVYDLWPEEDADRMHAADLALIQSGIAEDFPDRTAVTRHRGTIHVHMRKVALRDASGKVSHLLITAEDITERRAAEARLRRSELQFRSLTQLSSDWYWETDEQFRLTVLSGGETEENRQWISSFIGKARWEIDTSPDNRQLWEDHRALLERQETFRDFEYQRVDRDGRVSVLCISGEPFFGTDGRFAGYRGVGSDITARKSIETALRASEARFRAVVAALAEGVVLRDAEGQIIDCNASAERILGRSLSQLKGKTSVGWGWQRLREDGSLLPDEDMPSMVAKRTGQAQSNRVICYRKPDGNVLWSQVNVQPLFEGGNKVPTGFVTTMTDISQRKRDELEIVRLNVDLENRVLRRTAQLEAANKELEAFSYSVAHDLRSPLSAIDGFSALLQKALPPGMGDKADHYLGRIRSGVQRMGELTDGLLSLAQLSRTSLHWDDMDISAEAGHLLRQHAERDSARRVRTRVEPGMAVRADTALLRQVLENLISNAWKFTSKTPDAEITVGRETGPDQQPVYFVRDNGAGFDMAYVDKLFGTFQRLHSPDEFSGSGIGLATVKRIVIRHGGRIWAQAAVGEGSTFYFTLGSEQPQADTPEEAGFALARMSRASLLVPGAAGAPGAATAAGPVSSDNDTFSLSDQQFSNAFEHSAIGMALIAVDSRRLRVNSAFCQMLGYSEAEMLSRTVHDITHPDDVEYDLLQRSRALAGEIETYQWEKRYFHKAGHIVWAHLSCSLVRDPDRRPLLFISQVQDITVRKNAEAVLRESEERFRALTELASDWFWEQDEHFRFVQISGETRHAHTAVFSGNSALGKTRWELPSVGMSDDVWAAHRALLERHEVFRDFEVTRLDSQGELRYVSISGVPIFDASGRFTGYRGTGRDNTEIRRVSEALRSSEAQLREITDTVPALIAYVDAEQRFRFHNRGYEETFGLAHDQIQGKTMLEVMGPEFYERVRLRVEEVMSGYPVVYERTQTTARGDQRTFAVNYFPRYGDGDDEGRVVGFYSLATDITDQKEAERVLQESEERFRTLTQLSSDWFWEQDENFRFVEVKGKHKTKTASPNPQASIFGKTPWELGSDLDPVILAEHKARHERHEAFRDFEFSRPGSNGAIRYMSVSGMPIFDADGRFAGYRSVGRDVTAIRRAEEALRASESQLRDITDNVPAFIAYVDAGQVYRFHNRAYAEGLGMPRDQINGRTMREVLGEEGYELARPWVEEVLSGYPVVFERHRQTPQGDMRDYIVNYFPRYSDDADGRVLGFYSLANDVTELKRIDRMKSEFVSTVSHELRTPLTSIRGSLGLISGGVAGVLPDAAKNLISIASNNCERLIRLINDILDIEKIESGKMGLNVQPIDLGPLLAQVLAANSHYGAAHQVPLQLEMPEGSLMVRADSDRLVQVITNLLSNAMKFSPPDTPVEVQLLRASGSRVRVEVRDHGPGIPDEFRKRIFQKFSQADSSDTRAKGGTGLGLNISRAIIERLGGSIGFVTEAGVGTTFFFELPEWKAQAVAVPLPAAGTLPDGEQADGSGRPRVLVCEDDPDIARLIVLMLDRGGFDADEAYSAAQAQARLALRPYAAMTVDLKLPDADGLALIRALRSEEATRDLPIVVVSASAGEGELQFNNQLLSVSDWLEKPIDQNLLIVGLRRAIAGAGSKPRILHVEDDLDIQRVTAAIAQDFAIFEFAATLAEARSRLHQQHFDLVLLDLALGESSGWDLLADIEAMTPPPPVVVFSAQDVDRQQHAQVAAVLLKAQTTNEELLRTLQRVLAEAGLSGH